MYLIDHDNLTVCYVDQHGERYDLNAEGEPCTNLDEVAELVIALATARGFGNAEIALELLDEVQRLKVGM